MRELVTRLGKEALEGATSYLSKRAGDMALFGATGAAANMGVHAATGAMGLLGSPTGAVQSNMSMGGMFGSAVRGGIYGAALGLGARTKFGKGVMAKTSALVGAALSPKSMERGAEIYGKISSKLAGQVDDMTVKLPQMIGKSASQGHRIASKIGKGDAMSAISQSMSMTEKAAAVGAAGGLGFSLYSSNALGITIPSAYGYR